jgi:NTE family protein
MPLEEGIALCLSGGGYRAMLYHVGALWRLNEVGLLSQLNRVSSVSGGSITAGVLALHWNDLCLSTASLPPFAQSTFVEKVVNSIRNLADQTIDTHAVGWGLLSPCKSISDEIAGYYRRYLFGDNTLQDLPDEPRFVINATCVKTGVLWRFSKPYLANWRVGVIRQPRVSLARAVAASSAFPPFLSPARLELDPTAFDPNVPAALASPDYRTEAVMTDGGVYDNLGLETAWKRYKTILVSDGGLRLCDEPDPSGDWARHSYRLIELLCQEVSSLRQQQVVESFRVQARTGALWGIRIPISRYGIGDPLGCPESRTQELAATPTRLASLSDELQEQLINWGYASCDAALRKYYLPAAPLPSAFPYPQSKV